MFRKGLTKDIVLSEAVKMITENGYDKFSMRELASKLGVKAASLYNHIDGIADINLALTEAASKKLSQRISEAIEGKPRGEAFVAASIAHKRFAEEETELYSALLRVPSVHDERVERAGRESMEPLVRLIDTYGIPKERVLNFARAHRSFMHGFVELEARGFLTKGHIDKDESYRTIIEGFLAELEKLASRYGSESGGGK